MIEALRPEQIEQIGAVYRRMALQDDAEGLSAWIQSASKAVTEAWDIWMDERREAVRLGKPAPPRPLQEPRAKQLFDLFEILSERGVSPFDSMRVEFRPPPILLDWSKLPPELEYIREPAAKWGICFSPEHWDLIARRASREERKELEQIAVQIRKPQERKRIQEFLDKYRFDRHPEASRVYYLLCVIHNVVPYPTPTHGLAYRTGQAVIEIHPYQSVGLVRFGLSVAEITQLIGEPDFISGTPTLHPESGTDYEYPGFRINLSSKTGCVARVVFEFKDPVRLDGIDIFGSPTALRELLQKDGEPFEREGSYFLLNLGLMLWGFEEADATDRRLEVFERGSFDYLRSEFRRHIL